MANGLRKPGTTYGSCKTSVLRRNLATISVKRLGLGAALASIAWTQLETDALAIGNSPQKEYPACIVKADDTNVQAARGAFEAGKAAFNEGDYARAIVYWEDAFRRDCGATLMLKNLARAYEASGQYAAAAVALETYLARAYEAQDKAELEEQLRSIKAKIQSTESPQAAAAGGPPPKPQPAQQPKTTTEAPLPEPEPVDDTVGSTPDADAPSSVNGNKLGAGLLAGAGLALGATSVLFWTDANSKEDDANAQCPSRRDCPKSITDAGNEAIDSKQRWTLVGAGGAAMLVGGVVWYLLTPDDETSALMPTVAPSYAGFTWTGQF